MLIQFRQVPLYQNIMSKIKNKKPQLPLTLTGSWTNSKRRRKSLAHVQSAIRQTKKRSSSSAMHAMPRTTHTVLVSATKFQMEAGFAWNARMTEHQQEPPNLGRHNQREHPQLGASVLGLKQLPAGTVVKPGQITGLGPGA